MPPPPGMDAGPEPPPPPRALPHGYATRVRWSGNLLTILGTVLTTIGALFTWTVIAAGKIGAVAFFGIFLVAGFFMLKSGLRKASHILTAFKKGRAVKGRVASVRADTTTKINNRHPWEIVYTFKMDGHAYEGKVTTLEAATANRFQGGPEVWVLVVEGSPEKNTLYPPVK